MFNMKPTVNRAHKAIQVFNTLKEVLLPYQKDLTVVVDQPDTYYLDVRGGLHSHGYFFGAVQLRSDFVTFHFAGLPTLGELLMNTDGGLCIVQSPDGHHFLAFKNVSKMQLQKLKHLLEIYSDPHCLDPIKDE